ncbi:MAG: putative hydrolase [Bacteroidetes bacterium]|nr:putative hydrolase [Bacteroidota bacterium]
MHISDIENALARPLPGKKAQHLMAPGYRPDYEIEEVMKFSPKIGGVLLLINPREEGSSIIFTLRKEYKGTHSGQMSFPGGKQEAADIDITYTALRETYEEIGVPVEDIQVIGKLSELYIPPSNFLVYPTVGVLKQETIFVKQENEVEEIIEIPLSFFLDDQNRTTTKIKIMGNSEVEVPAYVYGKYVIWGATAIMMSEFVSALTGKY